MVVHHSVIPRRPRDCLADGRQRRLLAGVVARGRRPARPDHPAPLVLCRDDLLHGVGKTGVVLLDVRVGGRVLLEGAGDDQVVPPDGHDREQDEHHEHAADDAHDDEHDTVLVAGGQGLPAAQGLGVDVILVAADGSLRGGLLLDVDGDGVGDLSAVAGLVEGHDGVVEDLVGPRHAHGAPLLRAVDLGRRDEGGVHRDAHVGKVGVAQRLAVGVAADLVAEGAAAVAVAAGRRPLEGDE